MTENRFMSLAPDDPDDSDTDMEPTEPCVTEKPREDASADSDHSVYFDAREADDDTPTNWTHSSYRKKRLKLRLVWMTPSRIGSGQT